MRAFVVAGSPHSIQPAALRPQPGDWVVAADGGANLCAIWQWPVDTVVGDMDSIAPDLAARLQAQGVPFHVYPTDKDQTDLELALRLAVAAAPAEIVVAGALGARIDHTVGNLSLLALPELAAVPTRIVDGCQTIWLVRSRLTVPGRPGDTLSLLPFGGDVGGVSVEGVRWPLHDADLPLGPSLTISNQLTQSQAEIRVRRGSLLAVHIAGE
ncbi:MAG: thiamine diphosphokinase [Caldilineales bacterium]|nr:thiamine diphosphokinase [Caldilineales bacterium]MDW8317349.1 thiamine diphosphokinase [Anaerolineae bacterium]